LCPTTAPHKCLDGSCVANADLCKDVKIGCGSKFTCPDGTCSEKWDDCT
jgi:hypothetical protein